MALKRKEIKRGRKPGNAGTWASGILTGNRTSKSVAFKLGDVLAYDAEGKLLPETDERIFHVASQDAVPCPRSHNGTEIRTVKDTGNIDQEQARVGVDRHRMTDRRQQR